MYKCRSHTLWLLFFFNKNEDVWIRSGKATGDGGIGKRLRTHKQRAKSDRNDDGSRFYHCYLSSTSARSSNSAKDGLFEYLTAYIGASFVGDDSTAAVFAKDYDEGGIFFYTREEKEAVRRTNFSGKAGNKKFTEVVAYLFELGYDLALSLKNNVSDSPGFEGCGLIFDKKRPL